MRAPFSPLVPLIALSCVLSCTPGCGLLRAHSVDVVHPMHRSPSGVEWRDELPGTGRTAELGNALTVHYTARLAEGGAIDSTHDRGLPITFRLGAAPLPGWDVGLPGMRVGGERIVIVPPHMAYGENGIEDWIPPRATLVFLFELIEVADGAGL